MTLNINRFAAALLVSVILFAGCGGTITKVLSPAPTYTGATPVTRLYLYVFLDARPEYMHPVFRRIFEKQLTETFAQASVATRQLWLMDTLAGELLSLDVKANTIGKALSIPVGRAIRDNRRSEISFNATHRLVVFPRNTYKENWPNSGVKFDIKWDIIDTTTGYYEWSVYTKSPALSKTMSDSDAEAAARDLIKSIATEMRARSVIQN